MKNTVKALTLAAVLMMGTTFANAEGIIIGDRAEKPCTEKETHGIIIGDRATGLFDRFVDVLEGIIIGDSKETCLDKEGIIIGDREGIIIGDRAGIIIGD